MSWYSYSYDDFEDRAAAKARTKLKVEKRRQKGEPLTPVVPRAKQGLSTTFWGKAWNRNLEAYSDFSNRLPRGRTYLRQGAVMDLTIEQGEITSTVMGSDLYDVRITIKPLSSARWKSLKKDCTGRIGSLVELLSGRLSDQILQEVTDPAKGLFPSPKEILITCSCPDYAGLCKHAAATLYGVSCRLDEDPSLFFKLRGVDAADLIGSSAEDAVQVLTTIDTSSEEGVIDANDLSEVFGIDLGAWEISDSLMEPAPGGKAGAKVSGKKKASRKASGRKTAKNPKKAVTKKRAVKKKSA